MLISAVFLSFTWAGAGTEGVLVLDRFVGTF